MSLFFSLLLEVFVSIHQGFMAGNCIINPFLIIFFQFSSSFCLGTAHYVLLKIFCFYCLITMKLGLVLVEMYIFIIFPFHLLVNQFLFFLISVSSNSSFYLLNLIVLFSNSLFVFLIEMQFQKYSLSLSLLNPTYPILGIKLLKFH